jgi:hypothetical protein
MGTVGGLARDAAGHHGLWRPKPCTGGLRRVSCGLGAFVNDIGVDKQAWMWGTISLAA